VGLVLLTSLIAGPVSTGLGSSASYSTGSSPETSAAAQVSAATAVTQPLPRTAGANIVGDSDEEQPGKEESPGLASIQSVLQVVKGVLSWASGVMDALGRRSPSTVLRGVREMLDTLSRPAGAGPAASGTGARSGGGENARPKLVPGPAALAPAPAPAPATATTPSALLAPVPGLTEIAGGIDHLLWDHGINGLLLESAPDDSGPEGSEPGAFWAAAFLASGLLRSELGARRPGGRRAAPSNL
jgi:hypothetical protein